MADIKIDVSEILKDYLFPILGAGVVGLLLFQLFFHDWVWPTIISILIFLLIAFFIKCWQYRQRKLWKKRCEREAEEMIRQKMEIIADKALCSFRSVGDFQLDAAIDLYRHPILHNSHYNERFVKFDNIQLFGKLPYLDDFNRALLPNDIAYIQCTNEFESYNGGTRHYVIDPLFYEILENYVENGIKDYPEGLNIMQFAKYYKGSSIN